MANHTISRQALLEINGVNPYVHVTVEEAEILRADWRKPLPVSVQVNGMPEEPWHINMMPMGNGDYYLYLHNNVRKAADVQVGDMVHVSISFDATYQGGPQDPMPSWFDDMLHENEFVAQSWKALSPSRQKEVLRYIHHLQSDAAKQRNRTLLLAALSGKPTHFMGRDWENGK